MAMALMLQELSAENFSSGAAAEGDVLTADGAGGAGFGSVLQHLSTLNDAVNAYSFYFSADFLGIYQRSGDHNGSPRYAMGQYEMIRDVYEMQTVWLIRQPGFMPGSFTILAMAIDDAASPELAVGWKNLEEQPVYVNRITAVEMGQRLVADGNGGASWMADTAVEGLPPYGSDEQNKALVVIGTRTGPPLMGSWVFTPTWVAAASWLETFVPKIPAALNQIGNGSTPVTAAMIDSEYSNAVLAVQGLPTGGEPFRFLDGYTGKKMFAVREYTGKWYAVELATLYE